MKTLDLKALAPETWRPVEPLSGRVSNRVSERELERIPAWIIPAGETREIPVTLWDYSSLGFAVLHNPSRAGALLVKPGDEAVLVLSLGKDRHRCVCRVENASMFKGCLRIGLSRKDLVPGAGSPDSGAEGPSGVGEALAKRPVVEAEIPNPILFGEWSPLTLTGVLPGLKLVFESRDSALCLFVGQSFEAEISLPTSGDNRYVGRIASLRCLGDERLRIVVAPISVPASLANGLAELLAFEAGVNPEDIKALGFPVRFLKDRLSFRFAETMEDYAKVISLRRDAMVGSGELRPGAGPEEASSLRDRDSRILCVFHDRMLVASAGMTFPRTQSSPIRAEEVFPGGRLPPLAPKKTDLIEVHGLCCHRDYRSGDLLPAVHEHIARIFALSDRSHLIALVEDRLLGFHRTLGFTPVGQTLQLRGVLHHLIRMDKDAVLSGWGMGLAAWDRLYGTLMRDILSKGLVEMAWMPRLALRLRLASAPLAAIGARRWMENLYRGYFSTGGAG